jgi:hypothetical protein
LGSPALAGIGTKNARRILQTGAWKAVPSSIPSLKLLFSAISLLTVATYRLDTCCIEVDANTVGSLEISHQSGQFPVTQLIEPTLLANIS